jgi:hypothetical protein
MQRDRRIPALPKEITVFTDELDENSSTYRESAAPDLRFLLVRRWYGPGLFVMIPFCLFWDGALVLWYRSVIETRSFVQLVFPLFHVAAGTFLTYVTLCGFFNRTRIAIQNGILSIAHGPLPWPGNRSVPTKEIEQLFCREHVGRRGPRSFSVEARRKEGEAIVLVQNLTDADQALYIEQALEKCLGIEDEPVPGDYT